MNTIIKSRPQQVVIMHPCPLTLAGLQHLLSQMLPEATFYCISTLAAMREDLSVPHADLIVSELYDSTEGPGNGIAWLSWLQMIRDGKPLLVLTEYENTPELALLLENASVSLLSLRGSMNTLSERINQVLNGTRTIENQTWRQARHKPLQTLTATERQVYRLLQKGYGVSQIADRLCRSVKTVSTHKRRMMLKLNAQTEVELFSHSGLR